MSKASQCSNPRDGDETERWKEERRDSRRKPVCQRHSEDTLHVLGCDKLQPILVLLNEAGSQCDVECSGIEHTGGNGVLKKFGEPILHHV